MKSVIEIIKEHDKKIQKIQRENEYKLILSIDDEEWVEIPNGGFCGFGYELEELYLGNF